MSGTSVAFLIEKGGTGKSTIAFNVGWELSKKNKILLIDLDGQVANLSYFCGIDKTDIRTIKTVLNGEAGLDDTIVQVKDNLDILPADNTITEIGTPAHFHELGRKISFSSINDYQLYLIREMQGILTSACKKYNYVLVDPNPSPNYLHTLALCSCRHIIIPVLPDAASVISDEGTAESLKIIRDYDINKNVNVLGILFNRYTPRTNLSKQVTAETEKLAKKMGTTVFRNTIRNSVVLSECVGAHVGITDYKPRSLAAEDTRKVVAEIKRRIKNADHRSSKK